MIGTKIREIRKSMNMTQQELADLVKKDRSMIAKYELNQIDIPVSVVSDLAKALKVNEAAFFGSN
jgi:transcriptional regulator with XRE-family HTH domain